MASVSPQGRSPQSPSGFESSGCTDDSWQFVTGLSHNGSRNTSNSNPASINFAPSPDSVSLSSFAIIPPHAEAAAGATTMAQQQQQQQQHPSVPSRTSTILDLESMFLDLEPSMHSASSFHSAPPPYHSGQSDGGFVETVTSAPLDSDFYPVSDDQQHLLTAQSLFFLPGQDFNAINDMSRYMGTVSQNIPPGMETYQSQQQQPQQTQLQHISPPPAPSQPPPQMHPHINMSNLQMYHRDQPSYDPNHWTSEPHRPPPPSSQSLVIIQEPGFPASSSHASSSSPSSGSPYLSASISSDLKQESDRQTPDPIHKVAAGKIEKKKKKQKRTPEPTMINNPIFNNPIANNPSNVFAASNSSTSKFVIVTPNSIDAGGSNPYECFEAMRATQRGRKGPLANETKKSALEVRRRGACFCCHNRKVRCDQERPCKNCKKLAASVPQVICWQFPDFMTVLFPDLLRKHFGKEQVANFMRENLDKMATVQQPQPYQIELSSGARFAAVLRLPAKFFYPKTENIQRHYYLLPSDNQVNLYACSTVPLLLELDSPSQRDALKKKVKDYLHSLPSEPRYAAQVTDSDKGTTLPRRVLDIVQDYAKRSDSPLVKKALSIYGAHYVITRHLTLTQGSIQFLRRKQEDLMPPRSGNGNGSSTNTTIGRWLTSRVLNRQVKAAVDEQLFKDANALFNNFSKSLKPKSRRDWAPCLAAFLVLCLFMESVETGADEFIVSRNEVSKRERRPPDYRREDALAINREVENLPFKQFAFQFHHIYQTHVRDAGARAYNPLFEGQETDEQREREMVMGLLAGAGGDEAAARDMVLALREIMRGSGRTELESLSRDPMPDSDYEDHPYPRDTSLNYTGRLLAKFLLSFTDEAYIWGNDPW